MIEALHCPICRNPVDFYDKVHLDFLNTITHVTDKIELTVLDK